MNLEIAINKTACFYYWVQVVSDWDTFFIDSDTLEYYSNNLTTNHYLVLDKIKRILQNAKEPRWVLAELYSDNPKLNEAKEIKALVKPLSEAFNPIWEESLPHLEKWQHDLQSTDFTKFTMPMQKAIHFLDADFDLQNTHGLFLIQNPFGHKAVGLSINTASFILIRPSNTGKPNESNNTMSVIAHEYIHAIEQRSRISRGIFKNSYEKNIRKSNVSPPVGYTWKMIYVETLAYCFASTVIRGYLSPETYARPRPTISEMEDGFLRLLSKKSNTALDTINWAALNILPEVEKYINNNKKIDQHIADKISKLFLEINLT